MTLDDAYANAAYIKGAESYPERWATAADTFRRAAGSTARLDIPYGQGSREAYDLFLPRKAPQGLLCFVHGGYWKAFDRKDWSHLAAGGVERGWAVALPSYGLAPGVRISQITRQVAAAIAHAARQVAGPIALTGHSAGGHLVCRMLARGILPPDAAGRLAHVVPISPIGDLRPLLRTSMNEILRLDEAEATAESPVLMRDRVPCPVTVWVGVDERPAFVEQAHQLSQAWSVPIHLDPGRHHFNVIDPLADPQSRLIKTLLAPQSGFSTAGR